MLHVTLLSYTGGVVLATVVFLWTVGRVHVSAHSNGREVDTGRLWQGYSAALLVMTAYTFLDGIVHFATAAFNFVL